VRLTDSGIALGRGGKDAVDIEPLGKKLDDTPADGPHTVSFSQGEIAVLGVFVNTLQVNDAYPRVREWPLGVMETWITRDSGLSVNSVDKITERTGFDLERFEQVLREREGDSGA
jgi:hypothetical protein